MRSLGGYKCRYQGLQLLMTLKRLSPYYERPGTTGQGRLLSLGTACSLTPNKATCTPGRVVAFGENFISVGAAPLTPLNKQRPSLLKDAFVRELLCRFLTSLWGSQVTLCFFRNLQRTLSLQECIFVKLQQCRVFSLAPAPTYTPKQKERYPWQNGFLAIYLSVKYRDPALLLGWLQGRLKVMSMFAHLRFFRVLGLILRLTTSNLFGESRLYGFNFYLVGKISVAGNAMSRAYGAFAGKRSNSNLSLRLASSFSLIRTPTGCLGFTLSYFF